LSAAGPGRGFCFDPGLGRGGTSAAALCARQPTRVQKASGSPPAKARARHRKIPRIRSSASPDPPWRKSFQQRKLTTAIFCARIARCPRRTRAFRPSPHIGHGWIRQPVMARMNRRPSHFSLARASIQFALEHGHNSPGSSLVRNSEGGGRTDWAGGGHECFGQLSSRTFQTKGEPSANLALNLDFHGVNPCPDANPGPGAMKADMSSGCPDIVLRVSEADEKGAF